MNLSIVNGQMSHSIVWNAILPTLIIVLFKLLSFIHSMDLLAKPVKSGMVAIVGPPNAGKSTLMNNLLGQKISIVTPKPPDDS